MVPQGADDDDYDNLSYSVVIFCHKLVYDDDDDDDADERHHHHDNYNGRGGVDWWLRIKTLSLPARDAWYKKRKHLPLRRRAPAQKSLAESPTLLPSPHWLKASLQAPLKPAQ